MLEFPGGRGKVTFTYWESMLERYVGNVGGVLENAGDIRKEMNKNCIATIVRFMVSVKNDVSLNINKYHLIIEK